MAHDNLVEVTDPVARAKLGGIQESVYSVDLEIQEVKKAIEHKVGGAHALEVVSKAVFELCVSIQAKVKTEEVTPEEAKLVINGIKLAVKTIAAAEHEARQNLVEMRGQVHGMERAVIQMGMKFKVEAEKFERYQRMEEEEDAELEADIDQESAELEADDGNGAAASE